MKSPSTQGSAEVAAVKIDDGALFVQKSRKKVYKLSSNAQEVAYGYGDYASANMMELIPEIAQAGIVRLAVQRQPDTRVHCLLEDGSVAVLISQPAEEVLCWIMVRTAGSVEDVFVMPGVEEDQVYYLVNRSFGVTTRRYLEKWALESECQGAAMTKLADSHILYDDVPTNVIDSLGHLANNTVVIWGDGKDLGTKVVAPDGTVTLDEGVTVSKAVVGLKYEAWFKSSKLAYAAALGTALTIKKTVNWIGLILQNTHWQGLKFGDRMDLNYMDDLPQVEDEEPVAPDTIWEDLDTAGIPFPGEWDTDARLVLYAAAPRPVTVLAAVLGERTSG